MRFGIIILLVFIGNIVVGQNANSILKQGNAAYRLKKYDDAKNAYEKITNNSTYNNTEKATAFYNSGNAFYNKQQWQKAVDSYTKSLQYNASNSNAKYNLCMAKRKLEKQQEQQKKQQQQQKDKKDQDKKDQEKQSQQQKKDSTQQHQPQQNKPKPSSLTKQQAEQYLQALKEEEKKLLQKKLKGKEGGRKLGKDW
ncbi:MAG: hypothetical protein RLZZ118_2029 [Bacteroidota bacterium]|jgi:tetratricopeptide (TPR) repeat protein